MKVAASLLMVFLSIQPGFSFQLKGDSWAQVKANKTGTVVLTYVETPAFVYRNEDKSLNGICVDICTLFKDYVEKTYAVKINYQWEGDGSNFKKFYESVKTGHNGVFGLGNITIKPERQKEVLFTPPMIKNIALLVSHQSVADVSTPANAALIMKGFRAYVPKGSSHEPRMIDFKTQYVPDLQIVYVSSSFEALNKVLADPKSMCFQDVALYWDYKQKGNPIKYHPIDNQASEELAMIMPLDSDWKPLWDEFFAKGFKSGKLYQMSLVRHLGTEVVQMLKMAQ
jgi:putative glutamine transport system substrate-binding protein